MLQLRLRTLALALAFFAPATLAGPAFAAFPSGFDWGTAIAGFQNDMGGGPVNNDANCDWWTWVHDGDNIANGWASGDLPENGPGSYSHYADDFTAAHKKLHSTTLRLSIEWSRIFPTSTAGVDTSGGITPGVLQQLDALADQSAVTHYRNVLQALRDQGMSPMVTLVHFTLPLWGHDPIATRNALVGVDPAAPLPTGFGPAGWLDASLASELAKYAAYVGWKFGDIVDRWTPINEPVVVAVSGYMNIPGVYGAYFPPGAYTYVGLLTALTNQMEGQAAAYDALKATDTVDADGDGIDASVGIVQHMVAFQPKTSTRDEDILGAEHANYLFNELFLNAVILGKADPNADGISDPSEFRADWVGKADFIGVNYYRRGKAFGLGGSLSPLLPLFDFLPITDYRTPQNPTAPACPTTCNDLGWEIYPNGLRQVLQTAGSYSLPVYITENGLADAADQLRRQYLVRHLQVLERAIADGVADVRGYYHWSLTDNFEWMLGYFPRFGFFSYDPATLELKARRSAATFKKIAKKNAIPNGLANRFGGY